MDLERVTREPGKSPGQAIRKASASWACHCPLCNCTAHLLLSGLSYLICKMKQSGKTLGFTRAGSMSVSVLLRLLAAEF